MGLCNESVLLVYLRGMCLVQHFHHREATSPSPEDSDEVRSHYSFISWWQAERSHEPPHCEGEHHQRESG